MFKRGAVFYCEDTATHKQQSLRTKVEAEALTLLHSKNESFRQPVLNLQIARTYLSACDPSLSGRTWQHVMESIVSTKTGNTRERWEYAVKDKAFDLIRNHKIVETTAEHFLEILKCGTVSTNVYLRRAHNYALDLNWIPWPVLPKLHWPPVSYKDKRAITADEHQKIIGRERNISTRAYYELLWHLGGSQSDVATLTAEDIDWRDYTIGYNRQKTGVAALVSFGEATAAILRSLPKPMLAGVRLLECIAIGLVVAPVLVYSVARLDLSPTTIAFLSFLIGISAGFFGILFVRLWRFIKNLFG
jgi:hypothetical protein